MTLWRCLSCRVVFLAPAPDSCPVCGDGAFGEIRVKCHECGVEVEVLG